MSRSNQYQNRDWSAVRSLQLFFKILFDLNNNIMSYSLFGQTFDSSGHPWKMRRLFENIIVSGFTISLKVRCSYWQGFHWERLYILDFFGFYIGKASVQCFLPKWAHLCHVCCRIQGIHRCKRELEKLEINNTKTQVQNSTSVHSQ